MKTTPVVCISLTAMRLWAVTSAARDPAGALVETVRPATERFQTVEESTAAGSADALVCVSGPEAGAMGVHCGNATLIGDGELDPERPELLVYEPKNGQLHRVAVEYLVIAADWDAKHPPPSLLGQLFHDNGSPNRYGLPACYELHVWAWQHNPHGMCTAWNPTVACAGYSPEAATPASAEAHGAGYGRHRPCRSGPWARALSQTTRMGV
jgi:hypothetical protein